MKRLLTYAGVALAAFISGLVLFHVGMLIFVRSGPEQKVPDLVGLTVAAARTELQEAGFTPVEDRQENSADFGEGRILEHRPEAGKLLRKGRKVWLTVSLGPRKTVVPSVVGLSNRQAAIVLDGEGLAVGSTSHVHHPEVGRGSVIGQDPPVGAACEDGARVDLLVSLGPPPMAYVMPDLVGRPAREVESLLRGHGVRVGEKTVLIDRSVLPSTVLEHEPPAGGRVESGGTVDLVVSSRR